MGQQKLKTGVIVPPTVVRRRDGETTKKDTTTVDKVPPPPAQHVSLAQEFQRGLTSIFSDSTAPGRKSAVHLNPDTAIQQKLLSFLEECECICLDPTKELDISLGYHYTNPEYWSCIQKYGLLTRRERHARSICVRDNGATHGDGIYTSSNPMAFCKFRDHANMGLFVVRLSGSSTTEKENAQCDTVTKQRGIGKDVRVLRKTNQCVVLGHFQAEDLQKSQSSEQILVTHGKLVKLIRQTINKHFENLDTGRESEKSPSFVAPELQQTNLSQNSVDHLPPPPRVFPSLKAQSDTITGQDSMLIQPSPNTKRESQKSQRSSVNGRHQQQHGRMKRYACLKYGAPRQCLMVSSLRECTDKMEACPALLDQDCSICFEKLNSIPAVKSTQMTDTDDDDDDDIELLVALKKCSHVFHKECLREALKFDPKCPVCRTVCTEPQGKMPSGKMEIALDTDLMCDGFEEEQSDGSNDVGTWRIRYSIRSGTQKPYHDNPGVAYSSTAREAFLPNTEQSRRLLKRLTYAFSRGLTFTVGTSLTSGKQNAVVWASIHHKTRPFIKRSGSSSRHHGYPDPGYFLNCNEELDALGVPKHDDPSLQIIFSTKCATSVNFGSLFSTDEDEEDANGVEAEWY